MHKVRTVIILSAVLLAGILALYFGLQWFSRELRDKPYVANVKLQLRALVAGERRFHDDSLRFTAEILRVWQPSDLTRGITLGIIEADSDGFIAEGRHDSWRGRCLVALGRFLGDSLRAGEPRCREA